MFHKTKHINGNKEMKFLKNKKLRLVRQLNKEHNTLRSTYTFPHSFNKFLNIYTNYYDVSPLICSVSCSKKYIYILFYYRVKKNRQKLIATQGASSKDFSISQRHLAFNFCVPFLLSGHQHLKQYLEFTDSNRTWSYYPQRFIFYTVWAKVLYYIILYIVQKLIC